MPEDQNANGEHWTKESIAIFKQLGWSQRGSSNFDIECSMHTTRRGQGHGIDSFFTYYDPYYQSEQGVLVESKNWQFKSITSEAIKKWFKQITDCMECIQVSNTIQQITTAPVKNAVLMCWANDEYNHDEFVKRLKNVRLNNKKYECNIFVASNYEILRWCSLINTINQIKIISQDFKIIYPNVSTLGTNLVKAEHITLLHLYSKYIFAQAKVEVNSGRIRETRDQLIVFSFDTVTAQSLDFLYDLIRQLNLQDAQDYIFYFYEREVGIRHIVQEFHSRIEGQVRGDINNPSNIMIKYLDIFDGLRSIPDGIINFDGGEI